MDALSFVENFYDGDALEVGNRLLRDFQPEGSTQPPKWWCVDEFFHQWREAKQSGSYRWEPAMDLEGRSALRPLYLGLGAQRVIEIESSEHNTAEELVPQFAMSKSLGRALIWDDREALGELKALLLYAHSVVVIDPVQDFIDHYIEKRLPNGLGQQNDTLALLYSLREGIALEKVSNRERQLLLIAFARLMLFLGHMAPFIRAGLVEVIDRPPLASLGEVREALAGDSKRRTENLPRHELRAELILRVLQAEQWVDGYAPYGRELELITGSLTRGDHNAVRLRQLANLELPNLYTLSIGQMRAVRERDEFASWRRTLREALELLDANDLGSANEIVGEAARGLRFSWSDRLPGPALGFGVTSLLSAAAHIPIGWPSAVGITGGLLVDQVRQNTSSRPLRRHVLALKGVTKKASPLRRDS